MLYDVEEVMRSDSVDWLRPGWIATVGALLVPLRIFSLSSTQGMNRRSIFDCEELKIMVWERVLELRTFL